MADTVSVKLSWNNSAIGSIEKKTVQGLFGMGFDIAAMARQRAPYLTGALRNTIRVQEINDNTIEVIAGGSYGGKKVNYAWIREQGPNRNPATEHYMQNSMQTVMSGNYLKKYFGDIA
jgi:hypothetical protein